MENLRKGSHSVHQLHVHIVWSTKYRYGVLRGDIQLRCRDLIRQVCDTLDVRILKGVVSKDHVHLHLSYPQKLSVSDMVKRLKGRSARMLLDEFSELKKRYWGQHLWGIGYGGMEYWEHNGRIGSGVFVTS
jgi:putative transposase